MDMLKVPTEPMGPGLTEEQLAAAERELGQEIPTTYRKLLREMNGCLLRGGVFFMPRSAECPKGRLAGVRYLMGVGHAKRYFDLLAHNKSISDVLPKDCFEFASDSGGNGFVVFTSGPRRGEVAFRDHEGPFEVTKLTTSMEEFFERIVPVEAPEVVAEFPSVAGGAVKVSRHEPAPTKSVATKTAPRKAAKKAASKKAMVKGTARKAKGGATKTATKKVVPKKATKGTRRSATTATKKTAAKKTATKKPSAR
jgi:hypothetical protein